MRARSKKALIVGLSALLIAIWMAAHWHEASRRKASWEKAQEFNDFAR
jgi:hypothetical protein